MKFVINIHVNDEDGATSGTMEAEHLDDLIADIAKQIEFGMVQLSDPDTKILTLIPNVERISSIAIMTEADLNERQKKRYEAAAVVRSVAPNSGPMRPQ